MGAEWTTGDDLQPGYQFSRYQPEITSQGIIWTQIVSFKIDEMPCYTQMRVRLSHDRIFISHGRVYLVEE